MPPQIDAITLVLDRTGNATDHVVRLNYDRYVVRPLKQLEGGREARGSRTDNDRDPLSHAGNGAFHEPS